jgi:flavin-dependent dehydrogenase
MIDPPEDLPIERDEKKTAPVRGLDGLDEFDGFDGFEGFEVVVVGGGFAGAFFAHELAREGRRVALIERDEMPRYRPYGWLPVSVVSALSDAGLGDDLAARYLASPAARVLCARTGRSRVFAFDERTQPARPLSAAHAPRADLDLLLARRAREKGASVFTATRALDPRPREGGGHSLLVRGHDGRTHEIETRFLVDASGESRWMSARASTPSEREGLDGAVMETHVTFAQPNAGAPAGAADIVSFAHGAVWMLPLRGGVHALGAAVTASWAAQRRAAEGPEDFFDRTVRDATVLRGALSRSRRLHPVSTRVPVATKVERRGGPGWVAIGAAGGTVDPLLGMDAALAVLSVRHGLAVVRASLDDGEASEAEQRARYEAVMIEAEGRVERVARAVYRGAFADALLATDLSRADRAGVRAILRCELEGELGLAAEAFARERW